ncbi:hypothetical protein KGA66_26915 [Actinocrinis puniceicyclus]|uniref:Uncharacterized protein n=1 Tax=Actinocrinis puniceicyclus TaxID=977794 RepID=A0A8J8BDX5_9ACTN|nr:hypothetical protein [Actinocrinis puniceicyclus]MBS2966697.1 hypothetical protein [Actinocrinis puniceicyclus]
MASGVDQALQAWASRATEDELNAGPRLEDLGGTDAVLAEAAAIATGPQLPYLLAALARGLDSLPEDQATPLLAAAARGLFEPHAAWVLSDAIDVLCEHPQLIARLGSQTTRNLAVLAENALAGDTDAALARAAIVGLLRLAVAGQTSPHRLLALLADLTGTEAADALDRLPILIGVAHDYFADAESLLGVLAKLENRPDLAPATRADAAFELALADERAALQAPDRATVEDGLRRALMRFAELDRTHESRLDARAHAAAIEAILAFAELEHDPSGIAQERLNGAARKLDITAANLAAWTSGLHQLEWLSARGEAQAAWSRLVTTLRTGQAHLDQPSWYNPAGALNDLLQIYLASRSIHAGAGGSHGIAVLINPTVEAPFIRHEGLLFHLEQALAGDPLFTDHPDARGLYEAVERRRHASAIPTREGVPGKALAGRPALAALFGPDAALRDDIDPQLLDQLEQRLAEAAKGYTPTGNALFDTQLEGLLEILATSSGWKPSDNHFFTGLLDQFLRFLYSRFDAQSNLYGERTAYLGLPKKKADGALTHWNEKHLQDDFHQHLSAVFTPGTVQRELWDVAGGRADVIYTPQAGSRFVTEVKWRPSSWTRESVERDYVAQAANYTATGPPFGLLLVGDYSDHSHGYSSVEDSVWIITHARSVTEVPRQIVVGVLPVGRPTPSALRAA